MQRRTRSLFSVTGIAVLGCLVFSAAILACDTPKPASAPSAARPAAAPTVTKPETGPELHLIGIGQGYAGSDSKPRIGRADVVVDRPGQEVILALSTYPRTIWNVTVKNGTLRRVILCGYYRQAVEGVPKGVPVDERFYEIGGSGEESSSRSIQLDYRIGTAQFRHGMRQLLKETGATKPASFQGRSVAVAMTPILVDRVQDDPKISPDYPQPNLPADFPKLEFAALHILPGRHFHESLISFGEFTLNGPKTATLRAVPPRIERLAFDPKQKKYYGLDHHNLHAVDMEAGEATLIQESADVARLSWPTGIAFDTKRDRVLLNGSRGSSLYSYEPSTEKWKVIANLRNVGLAGLAYHASSDTLYSMAIPYSTEGLGPAWLYQMNASGAVIDRKPLSDPLIPGLLPQFSSLSPPQIIALEKHLIIVLSAVERGSDGPVEPFGYLFVYDIEKDKLWLASKRKNNAATSED
jgi:hypothetical protein